MLSSTPTRVGGWAPWLFAHYTHCWTRSTKFRHGQDQNIAPVSFVLFHSTVLQVGLSNVVSISRISFRGWWKELFIKGLWHRFSRFQVNYNQDSQEDQPPGGLVLVAHDTFRPTLPDSTCPFLLLVFVPDVHQFTSWTLLLLSAPEQLVGVRICVNGGSENGCGLT